jgi:hypothetical protein
MKKLIPLSLFVAAVLLGCPKNMDTNVAGTDEEQLDRYSARLEELRTRSLQENVPCDESCNMAREVCELSRRVCDIAKRKPEVAQDRCVSSQEDCARFNDSCSSCQPHTR